MFSKRNNIALANIGIFLAILFLCLVLPNFIRHIPKRLFEEFKAPMDYAASQLRDLQTFWSLHTNSKRDLIEAGRDLARMNALLESKVARNAELSARIKRYEELMSVPSGARFKGEVARVARRDINAWWQQLIIRKGSLSGIREGCAVIYKNGVVGRIREVNLYTSVVELVSSRDFRMAAHFEGDDRPVIYQGIGERSFHLAEGEVTDVHGDLKASPSKPLRLVTSSLAGTFPEGILIGTVSRLHLDSDGIFKSGIVDLSGDLAAVEEVLVLVPIEEAVEN